MNIIIQKSELSRVLSLTQSIVEKRTTMPILANVLLSASKGDLKISATDLEITAVVNVTAEVQDPGSTTVNARVLTDIVRELPDGEVKLKLADGERLEILAGKSKLRMIGVSAEEYPSLPGIGLDTSARMPASQLLEMINKTLYAVSQDETRFNLNGVSFETTSSGKGKSSSNSLRMVATDGHRLAMITRPADGLEIDGSVIVPRKGLSEIRRVLDEQGDSEIGIGVNDGFLIIDSENIKVSMRLIDGEFPDYNQVVPKQKGTIVVANSEDFAQALRRVALMVTDKGKCVKLEFDKDSLRVSSSSPELGDADEEVSVEYQGKSLTLGFNARYLSDFSASLGEAQSMIIELHGELGAGKFYAQSDDSYLGIVMPMRLT